MADRKSDWNTRPARKDELSTLIDVFNRVYHKDKDRRTLEWKYLANPCGEARMWVAESRSGEIVGSLAFLPRKMRIQGREWNGYHGADAMVLPDWQRRGVITELFHQFYAECWERQAPLVYLFPNHRSVGTLVKMKHHPVSLVKELVLPLRGREYFQRIIRRLPFSAGILDRLGSFYLNRGKLNRFRNWRFQTEVRPIARFDSALAATGMAAVEELPVVMVRDQDWLNWRYLDNPTGRHLCFGAFQEDRPTGYLVMECSGGRAYLADLLAPDDATREDLLAFAVQEALRRGGEMLQSMTLEGNAMDRWLLARGFRCLPDFRLVPLMLRIGPDGERFKPQFSDSSGWYMMHGDRDVEHMTP